MAALVTGPNEDKPIFGMSSASRCSAHSRSTQSPPSAVWARVALSLQARAAPSWPPARGPHARVDVGPCPLGDVLRAFLFVRRCARYFFTCSCVLPLGAPRRSARTVIPLADWYQGGNPGSRMRQIVSAVVGDSERKNDELTANSTGRYEARRDP